MAGFVKAIRSEESAFLDNHPIANHVLNVIARRARRIKCSMTGLDVGECFVGYKGLGISEQQYRTAKKQLTKWGLVEFKRGRRATDVGTVAKLLDSRVYDINDTEGNGRPTEDQRKGNGLPTTNKECKKERMEETTSLVPAEPKPKSKFKFDDDDMKCAVWMFDRVKVINPSARQPNLNSWANTIRLMRTVNKYDLKQIGETFDWANRDSFWCSNILSPDKLRKQWDKLNAKRLNNNEGHKAISGQPTEGRAVDTVKAALEKQRREFFGSPDSMGSDVRDVYGQMGEQERSGSLIDLDHRDWSTE